MIRDNPGHDSQGEPSDPTRESDSLPLNTPDRPEIALFTVHGTAQGGKVQDVRRANRLMLPELDLTASAELQALAASLMKAARDAEAARDTEAADVSSAPQAETTGAEPAKTASVEPPASLADVTEISPAVTTSEAAVGDLPLRVGLEDLPELAADDPGLAWFDDEADLAAAGAVTSRESGASRASAWLLTLFRSIAVLFERLLERAGQYARSAWSAVGSNVLLFARWLSDAAWRSVEATRRYVRIAWSIAGSSALLFGRWLGGAARRLLAGTRRYARRAWSIAGAVALSSGRLLSGARRRLLEGAPRYAHSARSIAAKVPARLAAVHASGSRSTRSRAQALHAWTRAALLWARIAAFDLLARLKRVEQRARHALSWLADLPERLTASVRQTASGMPLDDVIRGALFTAAVVTIVVVLARLDWSRPAEWSNPVLDTPGASTPLLEASSGVTEPDTLAVEPLVTFGRFAEPLEGDAARGDLTEANEPVETLAAAEEHEARGETASPTARRPEPAAPVPSARRGVRSDAVEASVKAPPVPGESGAPDLPPAVTAPAFAGLGPIVDAPPAPISDAIRTDTPPREPAAVPVMAAERSTATPGAPSESEAIVAALGELKRAYERRDATLAKAVWPTVDARALARAFDSLKSQTVEFDGCQVKVTGGTGEVQCRGTTTYVPRVGSQFARTESRQWMFRLEKGTERWLITRAAAR